MTFSLTLNMARAIATCLILSMWAAAPAGAWVPSTQCALLQSQGSLPLSLLPRTRPGGAGTNSFKQPANQVGLQALSLQTLPGHRRRMYLFLRSVSPMSEAGSELLKSSDHIVAAAALLGENGYQEEDPGSLSGGGCALGNAGRSLFQADSALEKREWEECTEALADSAAELFAASTFLEVIGLQLEAAATELEAASEVSGCISASVAAGPNLKAAGSHLDLAASQLQTYSAEMSSSSADILKASGDRLKEAGGCLERAGSQLGRQGDLLEQGLEQ
mmetsp:Transcript_42162/g.66018  ORF Transcript_42162/g.66018 Transcript_42162/m.66018 type:complete len:276 (-) Transcript_42162:960-1787(-)